MSEPDEQAPSTSGAIRECTICGHPKAAEIDAGLLSGTPLRTIAGTYGLARSSVQRHRVNHLSVEPIVEPEDRPQREPIKLVDVHQHLTALVDRLERVAEQAARTRKPATVVTAMREQRQALEAIAKIQADPALMKAASLEALKRELDEGMGKAISAVIDFTLRQFGLATSQGDQSQMSRAVSTTVGNCIDALVVDGVVQARFGSVDTSAAEAFVDSQALAEAQRVEAEVQRRVEIGLKRRENREQPAIERRAPLAIENVRPSWSA